MYKIWKAKCFTEKFRRLLFLCQGSRLYHMAIPWCKGAEVNKIAYPIACLSKVGILLVRCCHQNTERIETFSSDLLKIISPFWVLQGLLKPWWSLVGDSNRAQQEQQCSWGGTPPEQQSGLSPHALLSSPHERNNDFSDGGILEEGTGHTLIIPFFTPLLWDFLTHLFLIMQEAYWTVLDPMGEDWDCPAVPVTRGNVDEAYCCTTS